MPSGTGGLKARSLASSAGFSWVRRYTEMAEEEGLLSPKKAPGKKRKLG